MKRFALPPVKQRLVLHPGDHKAIAREASMLSTLLGSCVAVCLYDERAGLVGMNHFLLAQRRNDYSGQLLSSEAGRYGIHAMELLINDMLHLGAQRGRLRAKAFGGGNVLGHECAGKGEDFMCVGQRNVAFVKEFLQRDRIPLLAADLGGDVGRQIHFDGRDYSVYVRHIPRDENAGLAAEEREYWHHEIDEQTRPGVGLTVWE